MFFRRQKPRLLTFSDRLDRLRETGFSVQDGSGKARVSKHGCAAVLEDGGNEHPLVGKAGVVAGGEIAVLVNGGYQQFFVTPSGRKLPALAQQLRALHDFQEDLREGLGMISLYNTSLGTVSNQHLYDRVKGREPASKSSPTH
jgi:hypothetical protein